jgi:hypothetical protein
MLARVCAGAHERAQQRAWWLLARQLTSEQTCRLERLLVVGEQQTVSEFTHHIGHTTTPHKLGELVTSEVT